MSGTTVRGASLDLQDVDPERRAEVVIDVIQASRRQWSREHRRPRSITAREALVALESEAHLVCICAANVRYGEVLKDVDMTRLILAVTRIETIMNEVIE